ncbi:MAG: bifunctional DNA-formamidopyrimidine glycosylase/DNA-(apurinic or apyrimidinic site) lyase [Bryobacter sp.]|nr:bifunctional DNA-formamidopyrimidine glycosylase/DNA-(apurinic or apyrimidinic site) lyase [Bryobacter sp. CoA8 C33]
MPELPEVETVVRGLAPVLPGQTILRVEGAAPVEAVGRVIQAVRRYGKFIVLDLDGGMLFVHLGMTGQLRLDEGQSEFTRARFHLSDATLRFDDIRKFGKIFCARDYPQRGPDPLELSEAAFIALTQARRARIKALLLDQSFLRGMGNIYADEALFAARIHPLALATRLSRPRLANLFRAIQAILTEAIAAGGSSISDYVDSRGGKGSYQDRHQAYGRHGQPCPRCGTTLERILVVQRGTSFCPRCQRR